MSKQFIILSGAVLVSIFAITSSIMIQNTRIKQNSSAQQHSPFPTGATQSTTIEGNKAVSQSILNAASQNQFALQGSPDRCGGFTCDSGTEIEGSAGCCEKKCTIDGIDYTFNYNCKNKYYFGWVPYGKAEKGDIFYCEKGRTDDGKCSVYSTLFYQCGNAVSCQPADFEFRENRCLTAKEWMKVLAEKCAGRCPLVTPYPSSTPKPPPPTPIDGPPPTPTPFAACNEDCAGGVCANRDQVCRVICNGTGQPGNASSCGPLGYSLKCRNPECPAEVSCGCPTATPTPEPCENPDMCFYPCKEHDDGKVHGGQAKCVTNPGCGWCPASGKCIITQPVNKSIGGKCIREPLESC